VPDHAQCGSSLETEGRRRTTKANSSPSHHHNSTPPRQHPLICTGAEPINPVHGLLELLIMEASQRNGIMFLSLLRVFLYICVLCTHIRIHICRDLVHLDSSGPQSVLFQPLGSHCTVCACVCIYTLTPKYTPTRVKNRKAQDNTFVSPSVKNKPPRQMTSALHRLVEPPHPCPPTRMNKLCTLAQAHVHSLLTY